MRKISGAWSASRYLMGVFVAFVCGSLIAEEGAPFKVSEQLFDLTNKETLGLKTIVAEHIDLYRATEKAGYLFSHHPNLGVFQEQLFCMWSNGKSSEDRPEQRVLYSRSADGKTWSEPRVLVSPVKTKEVCVAAGFHVDGDRLVAYYTVAHYPTHNLMHPDTALFAVASKNGLDWSEPRRVSAGFFIEGPLQLPDGRLILAGEHAGDAWKNNQARMRLIYTDQKDGLGGWKEAAISPEAPKVFGYTEPSPFLRSDGTIVTPFRNSSGYYYASISRDRGERWSVPVKTNYPDSMARCSTGRLPNGTTYLINNPGPGKMNRGLLTIGLSKDGALFDQAWLIRGEPTTQRFKGKGKKDGWQYPNAIVWKEALWVVYSANKEGIALTRISLDQFN